MTLAPLSNKRLVRDLVTEIAPPTERFAHDWLTLSEANTRAQNDLPTGKRLSPSLRGCDVPDPERRHVR